MKPFTTKQRQNMERGEIMTQQLELKVTDALKKTDVKFRAKRHHYIVGPSGIGKSVTVRNTAKKHRIKLIEVIGVATMNAMAIQLATAAYDAKDKDIFVWIDDCDSVFMDRISLSVMKGALDEDRNVFSWNKNMTAQIQIYENSENEMDQLRARALRHYQTKDGVGIAIPTDNISFIVTSNHPLAPSNPAPKKARQIDEAAIRDRVAYAEYNFDRELSWGWTAAVTMKNNIFGLTKTQKRELVEFLDNHWDHLPSTSMRAIKELAAEMVNYPENYPDHWLSHLKAA
jgi:hypothetical protein